MDLFLDRIRSAIAQHRDEPAFVADAGSITYGDMRALIGSTMRELDARGVRPGTVVALTMSQSPLHVIAFIALARLGAVTLPAAPVRGTSHLGALHQRFGVQMAIADREDAGSPGVPLLLMKSTGARGDEADFDDWAYEPVAGTPVRIALTSGTVQRKGIDQDHAAFSKRLLRRHYGHDAPRVLPPNLHITAALQLALHALCHGGSVVFPRAYDGASLIDAIRRHSVTHFTMPAVHVAPMLDLVQADSPVLASVRHLRLQGGLPAPAFVARVRRLLSPHVYVPYSTTETGVIAMATPEILDRHPGCAGRLAEGSELEVVDELGVRLPPGLSGEIRVRVDGMPGGYHGGEFPDRFRDGWFHPRDRGRLTADGLLYVEGRLDSVINVGGRKVSPEHVEERLAAFEGVQECAVFAVLGPDGQPRVAAAIVPGPVLDWKALAAHATALLDVLAPTYYHEVESLPRNAMGKLMRGELAPLSAAPLRQVS